MPLRQGTILIPREVRFWSKVDKRGPDDCWLWIGGHINAGGYGQFYWGVDSREMMPAHRASWILHNGPIPEGLIVCHTCDARYPYGDYSYRACVNPSHLYLGTNQDNADDRERHQRRRNMVGENHPRYGDHRSYEERFGAERARELRANREGPGNSKRWKLIGPDGREFLLFGQLQSFCRDRGISMNALKRYEGSPVRRHPNAVGIKAITVNTFGWTLLRMEGNSR